MERTEKTKIIPKKKSLTKEFIILGILITILLFLYVETLHPYNFTKDDNLGQFLPVILEGMKQLFSGNFPWLNFHQFTGSKIFEVGTYGIIYPITILAYFLSHYIFKNDFLTIEIFVFMHILIGFLTSFLFLKLKTGNNLASLLGSLAFIFCGYSLIASSNWYYVIPIILFLPLILFLDEKLIKNKNIKLILILGLIRGIYFYAGNAQYFVLSMLFEFFYLVLRCYQEDWRDFLKILKAYILSLLVSFILISPLLIPQLSVVNRSIRGHNSFITYITSYPSSFGDIIKGSLLPYPLVKSYFRFAYSPESFINLYYSCTLFSLLFLVGGIYFIFKYKVVSFRKIDALFWMGLLTSILSLGYIGIIYLLGAFLPIIKNFSSPFKITIFSSFFIICFGTMILGKLLLKHKNKAYFLKKVLIVIIFLFFVALFYHIKICQQTSWSYYGDKLPLNTSYFASDNFENGRFLSLFTNSSINPQLLKYSTHEKNFPEATLLSQNFATYFGLNHLAGYEPFSDSLTSEKIPIERTGLINKKINFTTAKEYNVRYILIPKDSLKFHKELLNFSVKFQDERMFIFDLGESKGYVFSSEGVINFTQKGADFIFSTNFNKEENITLNFLYKEGYTAEINGIKTKIYRDNFGRMFFSVPPGSNNIRVYYYTKSLSAGLMISVILFIFLAVYLIFFNYRLDHIISKKFSFLKKIKKIRPYLKWILIAILLLFFLIFLISLKDSIFNAENIRDLIKEKININVIINEVKASIFLGKTSFSNLSFWNPENSSRFQAKTLIMHASYIDSVKKTMEFRRPTLSFNNIILDNSSFEFKSNEQNSNEKACFFPLNIYYPKEIAQIKEGKIIFLKSILSNFILMPPNKGFISLNSSHIILKSSDFEGEMNLDGDLKIEKYLYGNIYFGNYSEILNNSLCIILPLESKNQLYN